MSGYMVTTSGALRRDITLSLFSSGRCLSTAPALSGNGGRCGLNCYTIFLSVSVDLLPESGLDVCESFTPQPITELPFKEAWEKCRTLRYGGGYATPGAAGF